MASAQVALNGLQRCLSYTQAQRDSDSTFYSSSVESLKQIRELATQIMLASNEALAKVGLDEPLDIVKQNSGQSDEILQKAAEISGQVAAEVANQVVFAVLNQFNNVNQQNISINHVDQYNQYTEMISQEDSLEIELCEDEIPVESGKISKKSPKSSKNSNFIRDFKKILKEVHALPVEKFSSPEIKAVSDLVFEYFDIRFNKKYDPNQIHWFSREKFRDYLVSILLGYSQSMINNTNFEFYDDFMNWLNDIKKIPSRYTLPFNCFTIYFNVINIEPSDIAFHLDKEVVTVFYNMWNELWSLGYYKFSSFTSDFSYPDAKLTWVHGNLESSINCSGIEEDSIASVINSLGESWKSLEEWESFEICRAIVIRNNSILKQLNYEDVVKIPQDLIQKSLLCYIEDNGIGSIDRLKMKLKSIRSIVENADSKYSSLEDKYQYLNQFPPSDLELVEVLENYAANMNGVGIDEI